VNIGSYWAELSSEDNLPIEIVYGVLICFLERAGQNPY